MMEDVLEALRGIGARNAIEDAASASAVAGGEERRWTWEWSTAEDAHAEITVVLKLSAGGMAIPVPRERCLVGRSDTIQKVTETLLRGSSSRVLVHGHPGMGKDVVASEVVLSKAVAAAGMQLQAWLQASNDAMLRSQLADLFQTQMPEVLTGTEEGDEEQLSVIRKWLEEHDSWLLVVEDASWESKALWDFVPVGRGRLLVTSQMPLSDKSAGKRKLQGPLADVTAFELEGMDVSDSIELLRLMNVFGRAGRKRQLEPCASDAELEYMCRRVSPGHECAKAPSGETEEELRARWEAEVKELSGTGKARKQREAALVTAQLEYRELEAHTGFRTFLTEELGNVPLLVSLCGHVLRSLDGACADEVIELYHSMHLEDIDRAGQNPVTDTHYLGAVRSVLLLLQRLEESREAGWQVARRLMAALSLLPSRATPRSLFCDIGDRRLHIDVGDPHSEETVRQAEELLERFGLARRAEEGRAPGVHQMVQRVVREQWEGEEVLRTMWQATSTVLQQRLKYAASTADNADTREVLPSAEWFCALVVGRRESLELKDIGLLHLTANRLLAEGRLTSAEELLVQALKLPERESQALELARYRLLGILGRTLFDLGRQKEALEKQMEVQEAMVRILPAGDPLIATAMNNLAITFSALGKYVEALAMQEVVLDMRRRTLPPDDPDIASALNNVAHTLGALGKHKKALAIQKEVLAVRMRILPADHPAIVTAMSNLASTYGALGRHKEALPKHKKVLEVSKRILPAGHHDIGKAMNNVAHTLVALGRHKEALPILKEVLKTMKQTLPAQHPHTATVMNNLADTYCKLSMFEEARAMHKKVLVMRRQILSPNHPDIAVTMCNLAAVYIALRRHKEALELQTKALEILRRTLPAKHPSCIKAMYNLSMTHFFMRDFGTAFLMMKEVLRLAEDVYPVGHPLITQSKMVLAKLAFGQ